MTLDEINRKQEETYMHGLQRMLRSIRMACGFTQDDIAATLCINRTTYTNYETGKPDIYRIVIQKLKKDRQFQRFGVPINFLKLSNVSLLHDFSLEFIFELKEQ